MKDLNEISRLVVEAKRLADSRHWPMLAHILATAEEEIVQVASHLKAGTAPPEPPGNAPAEAPPSAKPA
jgi:hypothetical protein